MDRRSFLTHTRGISFSINHPELSGASEVSFQAGKGSMWSESPTHELLPSSPFSASLPPSSIIALKLQPPASSSFSQEFLPMRSVEDTKIQAESCFMNASEFLSQLSHHLEDSQSNVALLIQVADHFEDRVSALETQVTPIYQSTHSLQIAHVNTDRSITVLQKTLDFLHLSADLTRAVIPPFLFTSIFL